GFSRAPIVIVVGQVEDRPAVREGRVVARPMCTLTASIDHRVLDGYQAGKLAASIKTLLESPEMLDAEP
ncbi:MAG: 2-oxo acid dehydrogenase subunit E2, partial [Deltaproteobacteria bacterium]|nr:2-oxo acid dehydrogenase subunit E2 [Deltaproteobacteria bacterium]